jgi:hypothetical protein|tara:strand:- start:221 stop:748 length:528 start_codon:yes stop_codon:yes gene_type:complete
MPLDHDTYQLIKRLHSKHGAQVFGKVAQRFLAITLHMLDWKYIRDHTSEDADLDAISPEDWKLTFEVKTSVHDDVSIGEKDINCLKQRKLDGYDGYFAVMQISSRGEWYFSPLNGWVKVGKIPFSRFRLNRDENLGNPINNKFPEVVKKYFKNALNSGLDGLANVMESLGIEMLE